MPEVIHRAASGSLAGVGLCAVVALVATGAGRLAPIVGAPVVGLLIGLAVSQVRRPTPGMARGVSFCSRRVLQAAVASLGLQLTLAQTLSAGIRSLPVLLGTLVICLVAAAILGRLLRVPSSLRTLVGVGTAICGASAIAAVTPVIDAAAVDVAYSLSTVFVFNAVAVVIFPLIGHALSLSQPAFGLFAGTAVNDTSSVVAAGLAFGADAGHDAVVVKLTRTLFIIPICLVLALWRGRSRRVDSTSGRIRLTSLVPWFLVAFVVCTAVVSIASPPANVRGALSAVALFLITVALAAIGLSTDVAGLRRTGPRPLILGAALWVLVSVSSLGLAAASGIR